MHLQRPLRCAAALVGLLATHVPHAFAGHGQIPVVNGVIGAVPLSDTRTNANAAILAATGNSAISTSTTPGQLRFVENSGVCETTPGVYQASGYGDLTANQSLWSAGVSEPSRFSPTLTLQCSRSRVLPQNFCIRPHVTVFLFFTYTIQVLVFCCTRKP